MRNRRTLIRLAAAVAVLATLGLGSAVAFGQTQDRGISVTVAIGDVSAEAPGPELREGTPITLVFTVTNTGTEPVSGLVLGDDVLGQIDCSATALEPSQSTACERVIEVIGGKYRSTSVVSAETPDGGAVSAEIRVGYKGLRFKWVAAFDVDVLVDGFVSIWPGPTLTPGEPVVFTYRVLNEGTVPLERFKVFDPQGLRVVCPARTVDPGHTLECTAVGTVIDGRFKEQVVVRAWDARGDRVQDRQRIHYLGEVPVLRIAFEATALAGGDPASPAPGPMVPADQSVSWSVDVTNTGEDDLWSLYAWDADEGRMDCAVRHLAPGATSRCTVWGQAVGGPMEGEMEISAWASDGRRLIGRVTRHAFGFRPGADLLIETYVDGFDADEHAGPRRELGSTLDFTYLVHNAGTVNLNQVRVGDALFGAVNCPTRFLRPGETMVCSHSATAQLGWWKTVGTAKGRSGTDRVRDSDKTFWHVRPVARVSRIDLHVTIGGVDADTGPGPGFIVGDAVEIVYVATNAGNSPLWSMEIRDPNVPFAAMTCRGTRDPVPGDALTCRATIVVEAGDHWDETEAVAWNSDGTRVIGSDSIHYFGMADPN